MRKLKYITEIAKYGNIQKAAKSLKKNPSTLTRALKSCEESWGIRLFKRTGEGMILTLEGKAVITLASDIIERIERISEREWTKNEILYLLTIKETGNISRAAENLYIAQPSLSQMLFQVEKELGIEIFTRGKTGITPTEEGNMILEQLGNVMNQYMKLMAEIEEYQQVQRGTVTVGIPQNLGAYLLPSILPAFHELYPGVKINIREGNSSELERLLLAKKIDFCIMHQHEKRQSVQYQTFLEDPFYLVMPKKMKHMFSFSKKKVLDADDLRALRNTPFIMVASRQKLRMVVDGILNDIGIKPDICCTSRNMETVKRLVAAGMGVTFLPRSYLNLYSGGERLEYYALEDNLHASWMLVVAYAKNEKMSKSARALFEFSLRFFEEDDL